jgi:hypothetical protein
MPLPNPPLSHRRVLATLSSFGLLLAAAGCTVTADDETAPAFPPESGQAATVSSDLAYAPGPFGYDKGSVFPNLAFVGYVEPVAQIAAAAPRQIIRLAEFYNPTGVGVHEEGSVFPVGTPKPLALLIDMSARW